MMSHESRVGELSTLRRPNPDRLLELAVRDFLRDGWIDMKQLAQRAGVGRATLYRRFQDRESLLGEVLWELARVTALDAWRSAGGEGRARVLNALEVFMRELAASPALHKLLARDPETALRLLTSRHGVVQARLIDAAEEMLVTEIGAPEGVTSKQLAYAVVRIAESFAYADVVAGEQPDVEAAVAIIGRVL
ncbi:QsdR family transcriptional regulator [Streptomyces chumphonensis]|uniref:TetR family transcriptional regulator n=1 Tax=Streptomyces chumphonensis TaxID=1214925 RepID=A0A927F2R3_9ACTN|nr:QsdR family transcriptional regulator [Streptomyces chumphonensis]MBD3934495.1 TetR family transcriptional regulator [Streptomyces chumphonensis]